MFSLEDLIDLIEELRLSGHVVGTQQYITAQDLLLSLAARGCLPTDPHDLRTWLAPVLCTSRKEQENFYRHYADWLAQRPHLTAQAAQRPQPGDDAPTAQPATPRTFAVWLRGLASPFRRRSQLLLGAVIILLSSYTGMYLYDLLRPVSDLSDIPAPVQTLTGQVLDDETGSPLNMAVVWLRVERLDDPRGVPSHVTVTNEEGKFSLSYLPDDQTNVVGVTRDGYLEGRVAFIPLLSQTISHPIRLQPSTELPAAPPLPPATPQPSPTPTATPALTFYQRHFPRLLAAAVAVPGLLLLTGLLGRWYRRRALLRKLSSRRRHPLERIVVHGATESLYRGATFRRIAQDLRRHSLYDAREVDARLTVEASARKGGMFTPLYGSRKKLPEYLVLLERAGSRDQLVRLEEEMVKRLTEENVFVDLYHFQGEPRLCRKPEHGASYLTLQELAARHPEHYLIIFGDAEGFINPYTGEPERWLGQFSAWPHRALLTSVPPAQWQYPEWLLSEHNFIVVPAESAGLAALGEFINSGAAPRFDKVGAHARPFPALLRERPRRWLERHAPRAAVVEQLCAQLEDFLGTDGYHWLAACAVYPALQWEITFYLGHRLFADRTEIEERVRPLVRLPWFRHGTIPDWLRLRLIAALPPQQERAVRRALEELLTSVVERPAEGIRLDLALPSDETALRSWRKHAHTLGTRVRRWREQRTLRTLFRAEAEQSPLRDYVFLSFMSGRSGRLAVHAPETLRRLLYPQGQRILSLRPAASLILAALFLGASLTLLPESPQDATVQASPTPTPPAVTVLDINQQRASTSTTRLSPTPTPNVSSTVPQDSFDELQAELNQLTRAEDIERVAVFTVLLPYLPTGTRMTVGYRSPETQLDLIRRLAVRAGINTPDRMVVEDPQTWMSTLLTLRKRGFIIAAPQHTPHSAPGVFDMAGPDLNAIVSGCRVAESMGMVKFKQILIEQVNGCVHVEVEWIDTRAFSALTTTRPGISTAASPAPDATTADVEKARRTQQQELRSLHDSTTDLRKKIDYDYLMLQLSEPSDTQSRNLLMNEIREHEQQAEQNDRNASTNSQEVERRAASASSSALTLQGSRVQMILNPDRDVRPYFRMDLNLVDENGSPVPINAPSLEPNLGTFIEIEKDGKTFHPFYVSTDSFDNGQQQPRQIMILVDISASMCRGMESADSTTLRGLCEDSGQGGTRFDAAKESARALLTDFKEGVDSIAIVPFEGRQVGERIQSARFVTTRAEAQAQIDNLPKPTFPSNTVLYSSVVQAVKVLTERRAREGAGQQILIVFSDGKNELTPPDKAADPTLLDGEEGLTSTEEAVRRAGLTTYTVGFGRLGSELESILKRIAYPSATNYIQIDKFEALAALRQTVTLRTVPRPVLNTIRVTFATEDLDYRTLNTIVRFKARFKPPLPEAESGEIVWQCGVNACLSDDYLDRFELAALPSNAPVARWKPLSNLLFIFISFSALLALLWFGLPRLLWPQGNKPVPGKR